MNYFYDSVNCYAPLTFTCQSWGHNLVSLEKGGESRLPGPTTSCAPALWSASDDTKHHSCITWKNSEYRTSSISVGGNRNGNGDFQLLFFSTFLSHSSHYKIYKLYLHFNCSKFGVAETGLTTYILLLFEKKTTQKPSKVEAAKKLFYPVFMLHFFVYEQTLEEQRGWNW